MKSVSRVYCRAFHALGPCLCLPHRRDIATHARFKRQNSSTADEKGRGGPTGRGGDGRKMHAMGHGPKRDKLPAR